MATYIQLMRQGAEMLSPIEERYGDPHFEAKELLGSLTGGGSAALRNDPVPDDVEQKYHQLIRRRLEGEPLQYILGEWDFFGYTFSVGKGVLIPRSDTELLVELALKLYKDQDSLKVLDLCAGTGCIGLSLELQTAPRTELTLIEKSEAAFEYLKQNIEQKHSAARAVLGDVLDGTLAAGFKGYDLMICNPPYLTARDMQELQKEVTFEPAEALFGGDDGLDLYRGITRIWKGSLRQGGALIFETGCEQSEEVAEIMIQHGFRDVRRHLDIEGRGRAVIGYKR